MENSKEQSEKEKQEILKKAEMAQRELKLSQRAGTEGLEFTVLAKQLEDTLSKVDDVLERIKKQGNIDVYNQYQKKLLSICQTTSKNQKIIQLN